jgi:rRNA maturation protein Nop10
MLVITLMATSSNCGDSLKGSLPNRHSKEVGGQVNSLGYGKNVSHATMGNPQPSPYSPTNIFGGYGEGSET